MKIKAGFGFPPHASCFLYLPRTGWGTWWEQEVITLPLSITWESRPWIFPTHMTGYERNSSSRFIYPQFFHNWVLYLIWVDLSLIFPLHRAKQMLAFIRHTIQLTTPSTTPQSISIQVSRMSVMRSFTEPSCQSLHTRPLPNAAPSIVSTAFHNHFLPAPRCTRVRQSPGGCQDSGKRPDPTG